MEKFTCSVEPCGFSAPAERMWNLDRKVTGGTLVIICGRDARIAREHGIRAYRLSETIKLDAEREAKRLASSAFFQVFQRAGNAKARRQGQKVHPAFANAPAGTGPPPLKLLSVRRTQTSRRASPPSKTSNGNQRVAFPPEFRYSLIC